MLTRNGSLRNQHKSFTGRLSQWHLKRNINYWEVLAHREGFQRCTAACSWWQSELLHGVSWGLRTNARPQHRHHGEAALCCLHHKKLQFPLPCLSGVLSHCCLCCDGIRQDLSCHSARTQLRQPVSSFLSPPGQRDVHSQFLLYLQS